MQEAEEEKKVTRREEWIEDIKLELGGSRILSLEINEEEISRLINRATRMMSPNVTDTDLITKPYANCINLADEDVEEVLRIIPGSQLAVSGSATGEMLFDFQAYHKGKIDKVAVVRKSVTPDINIPFEYVASKKLLFVSEGYTTGDITIEVAKSVNDIETLRDDRALQWIYNYALALAKIVVGRIRSKVKSSNVPIELDGETILNEGLSEKKDLELSLVSEQYGPTIILR